MKTIFIKSIIAIFAACIIIVSCKKETPLAQPQKDVPNNYPNDGAIVLSDNIITDTVLKNHKNGVDYRIASCIQVSRGSKITIESGVSIEVMPGMCIELYDSTSFTVTGTMASPVTISGLVKSKGSWRGIFMNGNLCSVNMQFASVQFAGNDWRQFNSSAINAYRGSITLNNCEFGNNLSYCIWLSNDVSIGGIHNNKFLNNDAEPIMIDFRKCDQLSNDNTFTGNVLNGVLIKTAPKEFCNNDLNIPKLNVPYYADSTFNTRKAIVIQPGTWMIMKKLSIFNVDNSQGTGASFTANGTAQQSITLEGAEQKKGYWSGIQMKSANASFEYCNLISAGLVNNYVSINPYAVIISEGPGADTLNVKNCTLLNGPEWAIAIDTPAVNYNLDIETINFFDTTFKNGNVIWF
ncbi:MAG: right-handed parallel beta-helix repeat-containing protein [Bacteroidetes bacterium]|nr:right-handed parallel beta-helix repeat-containing protein [Bacteroidota bacterium]